MKKRALWCINCNKGCSRRFMTQWEFIRMSRYKNRNEITSRGIFSPTGPSFLRKQIAIKRTPHDCVTEQSNLEMYLFFAVNCEMCTQLFNVRLGGSVLSPPSRQTKTTPLSDRSSAPYRRLRNAKECKLRTHSPFVYSCIANSALFGSLESPQLSNRPPH
jgi:hypothetical protein